MSITLLFQFVLDDGWMDVIIPIQLFIIGMFYIFTKPLPLPLQSVFASSFPAHHRIVKLELPTTSLTNDSIRRPPQTVVVRDVHVMQLVSLTIIIGGRQMPEQGCIASVRVVH